MFHDDGGKEVQGYTASYYTELDISYDTVNQEGYTHLTGKPFEKF